MSTIRFLAIAALLAASATAQLSVVVPNGTAATEGNTANAFPWGRGGSGILIQTIYDGSNFTAQGVTFPIVINRLRWRVDSGTARTWVNSNYTQASISLSTCPLDQAAASTTFASNQGPDLTQCYSGPVSWLAGSNAAPGPGPFNIDVPLTTPFVYDPTTGDLNIETDIPVQTFVGTAVQLDVQSTGSQACRVFVTTGYPAPTGSVTANHGVVVEVGYVPAAGLFANFSSDVTGGASPLTVNFTDSSFSSAPGGVTSWAWDFDGDSVVDSTVQNPTHVYTACGTYNVSLTVNDGVNPPSTVTRNAYIVTDIVTPSFTFQVLGGGIVQFTDTSTPTPTSWAWDLNGDNVVDSTAQNPTFAYGTGCTAANVTLTVNRLCQGPFTTTDALALAPVALQVTAAGGNGTSSTTWIGNMVDMVVTNPSGINLCGVSVRPTTFVGPFNLAVYICDGSYATNFSNASAWRLIGTGAGVSAGGTTTTSVLTFVPLTSLAYVPPGNYGFVAYFQNPAGTTNTTYTNGPIGPFSNADVTFIPNPATEPGRVSTSLFGTGGINSRVWNGEIHYSTATNGGDAGYGYFAPGCAGALGVPSLVATSRPQLGGTANVNVNALPQSAAIMVTGFSKTTSSFGALPLDLTPFGAPGCFGRVSADATQFLAGTGNTVTWSLSIPNIASLLGAVFYNQALALDGAANSLGAVMSDAHGGMVGN